MLLLGDLEADDISRNPFLFVALAIVYLLAVIIAVRDRFVLMLLRKRHYQQMWHSAGVKAAVNHLLTNSDESSIGEKRGRKRESAKVETTWQSEAIKRALEIEHRRMSAILNLTAAITPTIKSSWDEFFNALLNENPICAALFSHGKPAMERAPVALLRLLSFLFAVALLQGGWGRDQLWWNEWSEALQEGTVVILGIQIIAQTACLALLLVPGEHRDGGLANARLNS